VNTSRSFDEFPHEVDLDCFEQPELYEAWVKEKPSMKRREISTLFKWDSKDGKVQDDAMGFNEYLLALFKAELASGWSISEQIDPFRLLPLEIQDWHSDLYFYNKTLLRDTYVDDDRYPDIEYADFIREIFEDEDKKREWETAIPQCFESETTYAAEFLLWVLEDNGGFESEQEYKEHCDQWKNIDLEHFQEKLTALMKENDLFASEYTVSWAPDYDKDEELFFSEIDFEHLHEFLRDDYNKWP